MVTASHNPPDYNGMKFVREESRPISGDTGLKEIRRIAESSRARCRQQASVPGRVVQRNSNDRYIEHLLVYLDRSKLKPLKIVVNAGNGGAGLVVDQLEAHLPFKFIKIHHEPDGTFPNGVPNPMLEENRQRTIDAILAAQGRLSVSPGTATSIAASCSTSTAASSRATTSSACWREVFLKREPGARIVHDPRLTWNTLDMVETLRRQGRAVQVRPRVHQGGDARGRRVLRRRDERAPLLPRLRLLRQRHDSMAAGAADR